MKLLSKQEVSQQKAIERKLEIDEGGKIAKRVDTLRRTYSEEEAKLLKFRDQSLAQLRKDIGDLDNQKAALEITIVELETKRAELKKPLTQEWKKLEEEIGRLKELDNDLEEKKESLLQIEIDLSNREKELSLEQERIDDQKVVVARSIQNSEAKETLAFNTLLDAQKQKEAIDKTLEIRREEIAKERADLEVEKRDTKNLKKVLENKAKELEDREKRINDKYETLLRTQERIKHNV